MSREGKKQQRRGYIPGLLLLIIAVGALSTAGWLLVGRWQETVARSAFLADSNPELGPAQELMLQRYLVDNSVALQEPAGSGIESVSFTVTPGETAASITDNLIQADLLTRRELFLNYLRYKGLDSHLDAGEFVLSPQWTIPELADNLANGTARSIRLNFLAGWRLEEMANYLEVTTPGNIVAADFLAIAQRHKLFTLIRYDFLATLPPTASLEGFLMPGAYSVPPDADASLLIRMMLSNFDDQVTPAMRQSFGAQGLSIQTAVSLASIVEREGVVVAERPLIAGVFYNRLALGMRLQADPTVQYAVGYQPSNDSWWKSPLSPDDLQVDHPYNTYAITGLPLGPINSPSLESLQAVAEPIDSDYIYFFADCNVPSPRTHLFSVTLEEHNSNVFACQ